MKKLYSIKDNKANIYGPIICESYEKIILDLCNIEILISKQNPDETMISLKDKSIYEIGEFNPESGAIDPKLIHLIDLCNLKNTDIYKLCSNEPLQEEIEEEKKE